MFGITLNPFIVYTSNIFAIISLRAFYSFIAVFMEQLRYLDKAVALVLGFIGFKDGHRLLCGGRHPDVGGVGGRRWRAGCWCDTTTIVVLIGACLLS